MRSTACLIFLLSLPLCAQEVITFTATVEEITGGISGDEITLSESCDGTYTYNLTGESVLVQDVNGNTETFQRNIVTDMTMTCTADVWQFTDGIIRLSDFTASATQYSILSRGRRAQDINLNGNLSIGMGILMPPFSPSISLTAVPTTLPGVTASNPGQVIVFYGPTGSDYVRLEFTSANMASAAADFFVNSACGNNGDGTASTCAGSPGGVGAFNDFPTSNGDCSLLSPGDIVEIVDNGRVDLQAPNVNNGFDPDAACSGTVGGTDIIFQNASGADINIYASANDQGGIWSSAGNNEFLCTTCSRDVPNRPGAFHAWYANGGGEIDVNYQAETRASYTCGDGSLANNTIFMDDNGDICVDIGGLDPDDMDYFELPHARMAFNLLDNNDLTFRGHPSGTGSLTIGRGQSYGVFISHTDDFTFDRVTIEWAEDRCVNHTSSTTTIPSTNLIITDSIIQFCGQEGIRFDSRAGTGGLVENTTIRNIQNTPWFPVCTGPADCPDDTSGSDNGTALRIATASNVTVRGVIVHDVTSGFENTSARGIDFESPTTETDEIACENCIVEDSYIYDLTGGNVYAFNVGGTDTPRSLNGTIIRNNRMRNVDFCFQINSGTNDGTLNVYNNSCEEFQQNGWEFEGTVTGLTLNFRNNSTATDTDINTNSAHLDMNARAGGTITHNIFNCPNCTSGDHAIRDDTSEFEFDISCTPSSNCVQDQDSNSDDADPNFLSASGNQTTDMTIQNSSSPACEAGVTLGDVTDDFEGDSRPQDTNYEIGADEDSVC